MKLTKTTTIKSLQNVFVFMGLCLALVSFANAQSDVPSEVAEGAQVYYWNAAVEEHVTDSQEVLANLTDEECNISFQMDYPFATVLSYMTRFTDGECRVFVDMNIELAVSEALCSVEQFKAISWMGLPEEGSEPLVFPPFSPSDCDGQGGLELVVDSVHAESTQRSLNAYLNKLNGQDETYKPIPRDVVYSQQSLRFMQDEEQQLGVYSVGEFVELFSNMPVEPELTLISQCSAEQVSQIDWVYDENGDIRDKAVELDSNCEEVIDSEEEPQPNLLQNLLNSLFAVASFIRFFIDFLASL